MKDTAPVSQEESVDSPPARRSLLGTVIRIILSFALVGVILYFFLLPAIGSNIHDIGRALGKVTIVELLWLLVLWFGGLLIYTLVLTGSLKGLNMGQALTLNLTGSAVANTMPFGGAVGMSLNYYMLRTWNMSLTEFSSYTVVTNVWNVLLKLSMPALAAVVAWQSGIVVSHKLVIAVAFAVPSLVIVVLVIVAALAKRSFAQVFARSLAVIVVGIARVFKRSVDREAIVEETLRTRDMVADVVRVQWLRLTSAMTAYGLAQVALLWACMEAVGGHVSLAAVFAAWSVERFLSTIPITPSGLGFTQSGAAGVLIAMGGDPTLSAAGVFLYSAFVTAIEVPIGGVWLGIWYWLTRRKVVPGR